MQGSSTRSDRTAFAPPSKTEPDSRSKRRSAKPAEARVAREAVAERQFCDSDLASSVAKLMFRDTVVSASPLPEFSLRFFCGPFPA